MGTLAVCVGLLIAVFLATSPPLAWAQPAYVVASDQDAPKDGAFPPTDCRSTLTPDHPCTLRAATETANTAAGGASINVPGNFVITLDPVLGELGLTAPVSITSVGAGSATVDGALQTRVFHVMSGTTGVTLSGLTVSHGKVIGVSSDHSAAGIWNQGSLTLNNVVVSLSQGKNAAGIGDNGTLTVNGGTISGNTAVRELGSGEVAVGGGLGVKGGGVAVVNGTRFLNNSAEAGGAIATSGMTSLVGVTVTSNTASKGGGGIVAGTNGSQSTPADLTITDSTISGDTSGGVGGGILLASAHLVMSGSTISGNNASAGSGGGMFAVGSSATLTNDTLSGNVASQGGGGIAQSTNLPFAGTRGAVPARDDISLGWVTLAGNSAQTGGGILNAAGLASTARDTVVAGNAGAVGANCSGPVSSGGYNLESGSDCGFHAIGDRSNSDPQLAGLANNGGPTETMALQTGSAALEAGGPGCPPPATDQRGIRRPQGTACDIGAFESTSPPIPAPPSTGHPITRRGVPLPLAWLLATLRNQVLFAGAWSPAAST